MTGIDWNEEMEFEESRKHGLTDPTDDPHGKRTKTGIVSNIPVHNKFSPLSGLVMPAGTPTANVNGSNGKGDTLIQKCSSKSKRTPPITVIGKKRDEVIQLCRDAGVSETNITLKLTSVGINVYASTVDAFTTLRDKLKEETNCFTHILTEEKSLKIVLKGLFTMNIDDLKNQLKAKGIVPEEIKVISPKKLKYTDQAHYLLFFKKGTTTINELRKCSSLCYLKVDWEYYTSKKFGPTQCHKCQMFAHGSKHCTMPPKCLYCADSHETKDCNWVKNRVIPEGFAPKCANCNGPHKANDECCPKLREFLQIQEKLNNRHANKNRSKQHQSQLNLTSSEFPALPSRQTHSDSFTRARTQPEAASSPHYNAWSRSHNQSFYAGRSQGRSELFSGSELVNIASEVITSLKSCATPEEQYMAIVNLAVKFLYNEP